MIDNQLYREEHLIFEVAYDTKRFAVGNKINIFGQGSCEVHKILLDTNQMHMAGVSLIKIYLRGLDGVDFLWRSIPYNMCILTFDAKTQLELA